MIIFINKYNFFNFFFFYVELTNSKLIQINIKIYIYKSKNKTNQINKKKHNIIIQ